MSHTPLNRHQIAWRAAQDIWDGAYVNLGVGMPSLIPSYLPAGREIILQAENGILGMGPAPKPGEEDPDIFNAGGMAATFLPGGSSFNHSDSFMMIRGGHIDLALLGGFEVSEQGDLANWNTGDPDTPPAVGGAMDLAAGAKEIRVLMDHTTKKGEPRIHKTCRYPLTAARCVKWIYTNLAIMKVTEEGLVVHEIVSGLHLKELQTMTSAKLHAAIDMKHLETPALG